MNRLSAFRSVPRAALIPALIGVGLVVGPLLALCVNIPLADLPQLWTDPATVQSVRLSLTTSLIATVACAVLGLPLALVLTKVLTKVPRGSAISSVLSAAIFAPVILSPVVSGLALIFFWGRASAIGSWLYSAGYAVAFTPAAVVLTQIFVGLPFFVATAVTTLRAIPVEFEEIAYVEGATPAEITAKVLLPLAAPGLATGLLLAFARALGEYGATVTFAGNIAGATRTIPLNIELLLGSNDLNGALGSSLLLISLYLLILGAAILVLVFRRIRQGRPA
ncbi:ABC transporter permease subunit [Rothia sp. LK2588]|uniref:ABC transporter permease n=1 Tax=Rothia sp. LK2588 TaxID=3114369 RepID=UPI0034CE78A3